MNKNNNIRIELADLTQAFDLLVSHLRSEGVNFVEISDDYYWDVADEELYNPLKGPTDLDLGQLTHDWERLSDILVGKSPPVGYGLVWLAAILRAIGTKHVR